MTTRARSTLLLRCFPRAWRERYGDELDELLVHASDGRRAALHVAFDVGRAGLRERLRASGLTGDGQPPRARALARTLLVLCSWSVFALAGMAVQKISEHWRVQVPPADRALPAHAFDALTIAAGIGSALVLAGVLIALPSCGRSPRRRELLWPAVRTVAITGAFALALVGLVVWARQLSVSQRDGHDLAYALAALGTAVLGAATLAAWTAVAVAAARRSELSARVLRCEVVIAALVAVSMAAVLVAIVIWWFGASAAVGSQLAVPVLAMLAATAVGTVGAVGAVRELETGESLLPR